MTQMTDRDAVIDLALNYTRASLNGTEWAYEDFYPISDWVYAKFTGREFVILHAFTTMQAEFTRGKRCGVCTMTTTQAKAANYDCRMEC